MPDSLKNMLTSVDWKKLVSSDDAKNALIGSALGGLMLGGASLASDRDPEESKLTPVGDALLGALLGGVAGYGVPKGLSMFRDAGSMAPDNDQLRSNALGWGVGGGLAGASAVGISLPFTFHNAMKRLRTEASEARPKSLEEARAYLERINAQLTDKTKALSASAKASLEADKRRALMDINALQEDPFPFAKDQEALADGVRAAKQSGNKRVAQVLSTRIKELRKARMFATKGYDDMGNLLRRIGGTKAPNGDTVSGLRHGIMFPIEHTRNWWHESHYAPKPRPVASGVLNRIGRLLGKPGVSTVLRRPARRVALSMLLRAGKYGAVGAGLGLLANHFIGGGATDNFKN